MTWIPKRDAVEPAKPCDPQGQVGANITFEPASGPWRTRGLGVLLTGRERGSDGAAAQFEAFSREHGLSIEHLWVAKREGRCEASALVVPNAGRTGMLFISPVRRERALAVTAELARRICSSFDADALTMIQALLDTNQSLEARAIEDAGAARLAELIYMERRANQGDETLKLPDGLRALTWNEGRRRLFERAIEDSYVGTLDCPGLVGLRTISDVIAGHMGAGEFDPDCWLVLMDGERPAGVMLLNGVPQRESLELVYLGLGIDWRGRGLGKRLVRHSVSIASRRGARRLILAVDANNRPAVKLYRSMRFNANLRKVALLFTLSS